jgi:hypothetical protein
MSFQINPAASLGNSIQIISSNSATKPVSESMPKQAAKLQTNLG